MDLNEEPQQDSTTVFPEPEEEPQFGELLSVDNSEMVEAVANGFAQVADAIATGFETLAQAQGGSRNGLMPIQPYTPLPDQEPLSPEEQEAQLEEMRKQAAEQRAERRRHKDEMTAAEIPEPPEDDTGSSIAAVTGAPTHEFPEVT